MRSWFVAASLVFALAPAAMSGTAGATDAAAAAAEKDARFFLAVCQNALDDLAAVSRLAAEQNWESLRLTALDDTGAPDLRFARYRVENLSREGPTLQIVVFHGGLSQAMIIDPFPEKLPPPRPD